MCPEVHIQSSPFPINLTKGREIGLGKDTGGLNWPPIPWVALQRHSLNESRVGMKET